MRLLSLLLLIACAHNGLAQGVLKKKLRKDFAQSRKDASSLRDTWMCQDTINLFKRDTIVFHNRPGYRLPAGICNSISWVFKSRSGLSQSSYFHCAGYGTVETSGIIHYKIKQFNDFTALKITNYYGRIAWFRALRATEYDPGTREIYPILTLIRLEK